MANRHKAGAAMLFTAAALAWTTWPNWTIVIGGHGYVPSGVYRCEVVTEAPSKQRVQTCYIGSDGVLFRRVERDNGATEESWFAFGQAEYIRRTVDTDGRQRVHMRTLGDCWSRETASHVVAPSGSSDSCMGNVEVQPP
jgi:hypothetical protein